MQIIKRPVGGRQYTWEQKIEVATKYMQLGNARLVCELTGVPYQTILDWRRTEWWSDLVDELKQIKRSKQGVRLEEIVNEGLDVAQERLQNGDFFFNVKTGQIERKPVSMRDASQMVNNLITRQIQMEELAEKVSQRKESVKETLLMLSKEFAKFTKEQAKANAQTIAFTEVNADHSKNGTIEYKEVYAIPEERDDRRPKSAHDHFSHKGDINAVSEKWEERLQTRTSVGTQEETDAGEGSSGAEQSPS
jgi:hypothetical protein